MLLFTPNIFILKKQTHTPNKSNNKVIKNLGIGVLFLKSSQKEADTIANNSKKQR